MLSPSWFVSLVRRPRLGPVWSVVLAIVATLVVTVLQRALFGGAAPWFLFTPVVVLAALLLGAVPAVVTIALSAVAAGLTVVDTKAPLLLPAVAWIASLVFVATCAGLVGVVSVLRTTLQRLDVLLAEQVSDRMALAERSAFLSSVLASSTDCIKVLDLEGHLTFMSEGGQKVMEVSDFNKIVGCPWPDFWKDQGHLDAIKTLEGARAGRSSSFIGRADTMAGTGKWWHVAVSPIPGPDGRPERILSVSRDITQLRESEEQRERYVRMVENSSDFIGMMQRDGGLVFLNKAGRDLVGLTDAELPATRMADLLGSEQGETVDTEILPAVERHGSWSGEHVFRHVRTGELIPVLTTVFPVRDTAGQPLGLGAVSRDFRERKAAEQRQAIVNGEIAHRLKNTLAMVQSIATMTLRKALPPDDLARFDERLQALARAHDLLHQSSWHATDLGGLVSGVLENLGVIDRCRPSGPPVRLGARGAMSSSLLLHELATNAIKYGAWSEPAGVVDLTWRIDERARNRELVVEWRECGGPPAASPTRRGFGSRLVSLGLVGTGGSELRYEETGLTAVFRADAEQVERA